MTKPILKDMENAEEFRMSQKASDIKSWLDAESEIGSSIMGEDGPVTRREVMLVCFITLFLAISVCTANEWGIWISLPCVVAAIVLVRKLNKINDKNN